MTEQRGEWKTIAIKQIYEGLYDGPHATPPPSDEGPIFLGIKNITDDGRLELSTIRHIAEADFGRWTKRVTPEHGDIVFTYEATLNRYAIIPKGFRGCLGRRMALLRPDREKIDTRFLYYYFFSPHWRATVERYKLSGATVDRIPLTDFPEFPIWYPPIDKQRQIAAILSAYDDLIENNTRRIEILEEMARRVYEEWFVRFRFPGRGEGELKDSEIGMLPAGWEVQTVAETFEILGGGTPAKKMPEYWDGEIEWYSPTDLTKSGRLFMGGSTHKITPLGLQKSSAKLFPPFSVMMTSRATLGVLAINTTEAATNQGFITCLPNQRMPLHFLYYWLKSNVDHFISLGTGATFKEITKGTFKTIKLGLPPPDVVQAFEDAVAPMFRLILTLESAISNLREQRDLLLPKLVSGQVDVGSADAVPEAASG